MTSDPSKASDDDHRVVPFRPRGAASGADRARPLPRVSKPAVPPVRGLAKYEAGEVEDNYGHRMIVNFAALGVTVALAAAGVWLAIQIAEMRKSQDCYLSGRRNCAPIDVKVLER